MTDMDGIGVVAAWLGGVGPDGVHPTTISETIATDVNRLARAACVTRIGMNNDSTPRRRATIDPSTIATLMGARTSWRSN